MGDTDLTGIGKIQQAQIQGRAAQLQNQLTAIPHNLHDRASIVGAVRAINPQMADVLNDVLDYKQGVPQAGATSGGMSGKMLPFWSRITNLATQADPTWHPGNFDMYQKSRDQFSPGGAMGTTLQRSNKLLASTAAVLKAVNDIERKSGGKVNETELESAIQALITKGVTGSGEYAGLMGALRTFAIESTAVSEGGKPTVTLTEMITNAIPDSRTPADIRNFVKFDLLSSISAIENAHDTWKQLPGNATTEPLGYRADVYNGLQAVANTLDPATGSIEGKDLPPILKSVIPSQQAPSGGGGGSSPPRIGPNGEGYDNVPKGGQYIGPDGKTYTKG